MGGIAFQKGAKEWQNPMMDWLIGHYRTAVHKAIVHRNITLGVSLALFLGAIYLSFGGPIGSEFLPHLDEGSIWVRGTLPPSEGPTASIDFTNKARIVMASFPEVKHVVSQTGRPDDGTDTAGFFNTEYFVDLKQKGTMASRLPPEQRGIDRCNRSSSWKGFPASSGITPSPSPTTWRRQSPASKVSWPSSSTATICAPSSIQLSSSRRKWPQSKASRISAFSASSDNRT